MNLVKTIVGILIFLIILHLIFSWLFQSGTKITSMEPATKSQVIDASKLPDNNTSNFTYSTWFYVNDWNFEFGKPKILLARTNSSGATTFKVSLGATENNIDIDVLCYSSSSSSGSSWLGGSDESITRGPWIGGRVELPSIETCPTECWSCTDGSRKTGGVALTNNMCTSHCSKQTSTVPGWNADWTGTPTCNSLSKGTDCSGCPSTGFGAGSGSKQFFNLWDWFGKCTGLGKGYGCCSGSLDFAACTDASCSNCNDAAGLRAQQTNAMLPRFRAAWAGSGELIDYEALQQPCSSVAEARSRGPGTEACSKCAAIGKNSRYCAACCTGDGLDVSRNGFTTRGTGTRHKCTIRNFPLQKWVNLTMSLYGRTLDVYIDGKLVRTCILPGVAKSGTGGSILVTPGNGFSGWTSQTRYWPDATNPQEAYGIYKEGYGGSIIGNLFNKYRVRVSFLEDNQSKGSFEL